MKRQNIDGRPIFRDELWHKMLEVGDFLLKLGFKESNQKPNLFYKKLFDNKSDNEYKILFADFRGSENEPIWERLRISLYPKSDWKCNGMDIQFHLILLKRYVDISIDYSNDYRIFGNISGYCKTCGKDILLNRDLNKIQYKIGLNSYVELFYCNDCKIKQYEIEKKKLCIHCKVRKWKEIHCISYDPEIIINVCKDCHIFIHDSGFPNFLWKQKRPCFHCKSNEAEINHHIKYEPEETIFICYKCHSKIHNYGFPNLLWKQMRKDFLEIKKKRNEERKRKNEQERIEKESVRRKKEIVKRSSAKYVSICKKCYQVKYSSAKTSKCSYCGTELNQDLNQTAKFHCSKCLKSWSGIIFSEFCPLCLLTSEKKISKEERMKLKINIRSMQDRELRKKYIDLFNKN